MREEIRVRPVTGIGEVESGARLGEMVAASATLAAGDIVVISQKAVSKAEGRVARLDEVTPGDRARALAAEGDRDPRLVELILGEARRLLRAERGLLIAETHHGLICANAGIDTSNLPGEETVALLPRDPDASAREIRAQLRPAMGRGAGGEPGPAVVISDSFGRAWRLGQAEVAIGCAGLVPLDDWRGRTDATGRELRATVIAVADQVAAAADLARDKTSRTPAVVVSGLGQHVTAADGPGAAALLRPEAEDLFR